MVDICYVQKTLVPEVSVLKSYKYIANYILIVLFQYRRIQVLS